MGFKAKKAKHSKRSQQQQQQQERPREQDEIDDERFQAALNRPQFSKPKSKETKVALDDRFASVLTDPRFQLQGKDKYGRRKQQQQNRTEELSAFYRIENKDPDGDAAAADDKSHESDSDKSESPAKESESNDESVEDPASRIRYLTALSRGELSVSSSSSEDEADDDTDDSDDSVDNDEQVDAAVYGTTGVLDPSSKQQDEEVSLTHEPSPYVAVMDMDWAHVRAVDLFAILASFSPPGALRRVQVFPSNLGLERMAKEAKYGPTDLWKSEKRKSNENDDDVEFGNDDDDDDQMNRSESESESFDEQEQYLKQLRIENEEKESDFDTEKLRAYEASKLKYFFAVAEFASTQHADAAYKELDGMELEHSSAAMDMRSIPPNDLEGVVEDRELRDEATSIPSNYRPPDFVVNALQQSNVRCTWEDGDEERQRKLTSYGTGEHSTWGEAAENDDLRAYLASDASSSEEDESGDEHEKASKLRKMLLGDEASDGDDESDDVDGSESSSDDEADDNDEFSMQATFIPGQVKLEDRIRSRLEAKKELELTPWEKYQERRKAKRRERRQARRNLRKGVEELEDGESESDPEFGKATFGSDVEDNEGAGRGFDDDFFMESTQARSNGSKRTKMRRDGENDARAPSTKEELELLLAGDNDEEDEKDYNMRGLQRIEKNKNKRMRGSRKRKEKELATAVSGKDFHIDTKDSRFAAVLEGKDDRFGIDPTDPNYKETEAMKVILAEQSKRRKAKKQKRAAAPETVVPNVSAASDGVAKSSGAAALSSLVMSLKTKVAENKSQ